MIVYKQQKEAMKHKEMLIAGDWFNQTFDLVPAKQANISYEQGEKFFGETLVKIKEINPNLTFEFSRWPCLTIMNGDETIGVFAHPDANQRHEHTKKFGSNVALFNGAFDNKDIVENLRSILPLFNSSFEQLKVRDDLGERKTVADYSLNSITKGAFDHVHFAELRSLYVTPTALAENFNKLNGYDKGWIDGDRDRELSEEYINLLKENPAFFKFSNEQDEQLDKNLQEAFKVLDENVPLADKHNLMDALKAQKLVDDYKIKERRELEEEAERIEKIRKEHDLYWHPKKGNPYDDEKQNKVSLCNKYGRELVSFNKLSGDVNIHAAGMHNESALAAAAAVAFDRFGHDKVYWNVNRGFRKNTSQEELAVIADRTLEALIKAGFEPEQVVFPKDLQYLIDRKIEEMKNIAVFSQATPDQIAEADKVMDDLPKQTDDVVTESLPEAQSVKSVTIPDVSVSVVAEAPESPSVIPETVVGDSVPASKAEEKIAKKIVNGCYLVKSKKADEPDKDVYQLIGVKGKANIDSESVMRQVTQRLADAEGIKINQINGCWLTHDSTPLYTIAAIKKFEADKLKGLSIEEQAEMRKNWKVQKNFQFAYDVIGKMKSEYKDSLEVTANPNTDISGFDVATTVETDAPAYKTSEDLEKHVAKVVGKPDALDSDEYKDYQQAKADKAAGLDSPDIKNGTERKKSEISPLDDFDVNYDEIEKIAKDKKDKLPKLFEEEHNKNTKIKL